MGHLTGGGCGWKHRSCGDGCRSGINPSLDLRDNATEKEGGRGRGQGRTIEMEGWGAPGIREDLGEPEAVHEEEGEGTGGGASGNVHGGRNLSVD